MELEKFLRYIKEYRTDGYGQLEIVDDGVGDELDPTIKRVVDEYLKESKRI